MSVKEKIKGILRPKLKLLPGTRLASFLFIAVSIAIAAGILFAANLYYNIDSGEIIMEEIQRATQVIRATVGLIVGGSATQNPTTGYVFEVVGTARLATTTVATGTVELTAAEQVLRFTGGVSGYYVELKANTSATSGQAITYTLPAVKPDNTNFVLTSSPTGAWSWQSVSGVGAGDIQAVGDVSSGPAFTSDIGTAYGNTLWFHPVATSTMALTAASGLTANATTVIPAVSGTNYLTVTPSALTSGRVLLATGSYTLGDSANLTFDTANRILTIGSSGNAGQLRIYNDSYYLGFTATSTMTQNTLYYWPTNYGSANYVLTTSGSGDLSWQSVSGVGGVTGTGAANQVTYWTGGSSVSGDAGLTYDAANDRLTISGSLIANLIESPAGQDLTLNPATGIVQLANGDYIRTFGGYEIGRTGTQILREMVPIFGFDLPTQTATTSYVQISRVIEDYPFSSAATGTTRVHKFIIRYADATTTSSTNWRVYNVTTGATTATFTVPPSDSTDLSKGEAHITGTVTIPTNTDDWRLDLYTPGTAIRVYQIFLAAYDQIQ